MKNTEKIIEQTNGTMSISGMPLTSADKDRIRKCVGNDTLVEETIKKLITKHTQQNI